MRKTPKMREEAAGAATSGGNSASTKNRVLESARYLFPEYGFHGTHLRDVCEHAGANIAAACYYFHSKEELYDAVASEACQRLAARGASPGKTGRDATAHHLRLG